jgi:hypothetical protein
MIVCDRSRCFFLGEVWGDSDRGNIPPPFLRRVNGGRTVEVGLAYGGKCLVSSVKCQVFNLTPDT